MTLNLPQDYQCQLYHCKNKLVVLTTEWLPWLPETNWWDSGYERFTVVLETNWIRQPKGSCPLPLTTTNMLLMQAGDSLRVVSWLYMMNWAATSFRLNTNTKGNIFNCVRIPKQTSHNHCLSSLSASMVTTLVVKTTNLFLQCATCLFCVSRMLLKLYPWPDFTPRCNNDLVSQE